MKIEKFGTVTITRDVSGVLRVVVENFHIDGEFTLAARHEGIAAAILGQVIQELRGKEDKQ